MAQGQKPVAQGSQDRFTPICPRREGLEVFAVIPTELGTLLDFIIWDEHLVAAGENGVWTMNLRTKIWRKITL